MQDREQPAAAAPTSTAAQPEATTPEPVSATASSTRAPTEDKARSASISPPPATKPSPFAGQPRTTSPSASPPPVQSSSPPILESRPANTGVQDVPRDPQVAALKAIFPDYDELILQSVLESVNGDQDRAVDVLLGMNDPDFHSEAPPPVQQPQMTQEELDEQLARRLMLEEQQHVQQWETHRRQQHRQQRRSSRAQGYEQQQPQQQTTSPPVGGKDTMTEFQEQFAKIAETGKRTFGAFVSKVKAKIQDFDKPNPEAGGSGVQPTWGGSNAGYYDPNNAQSPPPRTNYLPYDGHHSQSNYGVQSPPASTPANTAISQPAAFYDPNPSPQPLSPPTQYTSPTLSEKKQSSIAVEGYDVTPLPSDTASSATPGAGSASGSQPAQSTTTAATSGSSFATSAPQRGPSPPNPIDGGKLGLLPKRPISLIRDPAQNQPQPQRRHLDDDDNDLEYAESPFDDDRK